MVEENLIQNSKSRYNKIQALLSKEKANLSTINAETSVDDRIKALLEERKRRFYSFDSVDTADIVIPFFFTFGMFVRSPYLLL